MRKDIKENKQQDSKKKIYKDKKENKQKSV
jgi:hypothetical protein